MRALSVWILPVVVSSCGSAVTAPANIAPDLPVFVGAETDRWLVEESAPVERDDILPAFIQSARSYGCHTERIGDEYVHNVLGEGRSYFGVSASCREGTIALITLVGGRVRIGCAKPTTHEACDRLLRNIAEGG